MTPATRSFNFGTLTNVQLISWALSALEEYRERTGLYFPMTETALKDERRALREQHRQAVRIAKNAPAEAV